MAHHADGIASTEDPVKLGSLLAEIGRELRLSDDEEPVRFLVCRGHETIRGITSYDRRNRDKEE
jgi:hypothetical protein